jgi:hypothetical protein
MNECIKKALFYLGSRILSNGKIKPKLQRKPTMPGNFTNHYRYNLELENFRYGYNNVIYIELNGYFDIWSRDLNTN